jgi:long-chain acyl-CoA synthetase
VTDKTLSKYWLENVDRFRGTGKVAVRQKDLGIWQSHTWDQEYNHVRDFCLGLAELGFQRGDRVAILGDNDREYLWASLSIMAAGGTVVGLFTDVGPTEVEYIVSHSDATFVLAGDQEQCDKLLAVKESLPLVKKVIYWDDRGMWYYDDPWLVEFHAVQLLGQQSDGEANRKFIALIEAGESDDPAMFCYTSGTTGHPKGVMLSHANFLYSDEAYHQVDPRYDTDNYLSFLPLAWVGGAALDIAPHAIRGVILNFAESPETVQANIREIAPDTLLYNSRLWETLVASIRARILDSGRLEQFMYKQFLNLGYRVADYKFRKQPIPAYLQALNQLGELMMYRPLLGQYGLHKARSTYTAGSSLSPDVIRFFRALGLPLRQIYASTETTGTALLHHKNDVKFESVGIPVPGTKVDISEEGEILLTNPGLFLGYHKDPEETKSAIHVDGNGVRWFRTEDAGHLDLTGHLIYLDRMKDMIELASGDKYSPQYIEGRLKFSPFVSHAMTIGNQDHDYVTALITIDFENVGRWAEKSGIGYTTFTDLSQKPQVYQLIGDDVEAVNHTLPASGRVRRFVILHKEFDADEGEMTRTRKLRRAFLAERYSEIIDTLYSEREEVNVRASVQYQDGRTATVDTTLHIRSLETGS